MKDLKHRHPLLKPAFGALVDLPSPTNISYWWNFGSLLFFCLVIQLITGLFLAIYYTSDITTAFNSVVYIGRDVNYGWLFRMIHANGASAFFIALYLHAGRGIYYGRYRFHPTWTVGVILLLATMATAFLGYVLPWGQMSFWGASVITNLFSAIPYLGGDFVIWLWGGLAVDSATLTRFFAFHFLLPFIIAALAFVHLVFLHETGSNNPLGVNSNLDKSPLHPYFLYKDLFGLIIFSIGLFIIVFFFSWTLGDPENFIPANLFVTPVHIQPEWYFLFAYAILRSIPNKLGGVLALAGAVLILFILPPLANSCQIINIKFIPLNKRFFWILVRVVLILTWIGARPVEDPFILIGQILTIVYFALYLVMPNFSKITFWALKNKSIFSA